MVAIGVSASIKRLGKTLVITMKLPDKHSVLQLTKPIKNGETQDGLLVLDWGQLTFIPNAPPFEVQMKMIRGGRRWKKY